MAAIKQVESTALPQWDMTPIFVSLEAPEFNEEFEGVVSSLQALVELFDSHDIRKQDRVDLAEAVKKYEAVLPELNDLQERVRTLGSYISSFVATDSRNDLAQAKMSEFSAKLIDLSKLGTRFNAWIGSLDVEGLIEQSELAADHAFVLRKAAIESKHLMSEPEEELAVMLSLSGSRAWARLHGDVSSRLTVQVEKPEGVRELPMSAVRGLAQDPDPSVRKAAYEAEIKSWEAVAVPLAASLNSIKGERNTLNRRRGWQDSVEPALVMNNIDRQTLEAMQAACVESFPDFRRYLATKAKYLGKEKLAWWDLFAPLGDPTVQRKWAWEEATDYIVDQFGVYSPRLSDMARRAFEERWVDAEPRAGKRDGAFCMGVRKDESRVLMNFTGSFNGVHTLAHELGHAYHNINLAHRLPTQRSTPMALAETASIFCETIVTHAALQEATEEEKLPILEGDLQSNCQVVVDIHSRFLFEKGVFEGRERRDLSVDELNNLMLDAQRQTYGDGLEESTLHPYMWAVKPHYYGLSYYNWPYTFGLLFGLGLYAQYRENPDKFRAGYDDLLSSTGLEDAASLCGRFGFDIRSIDFWRSSLDIIRERIAQFSKLAI